MTIQQSTTRNDSINELPMYDLEKMVMDEFGKPISKGGVACPFPWRLHECLDAVEREGLEHIVSWQSHGRSFTVFEPKKFAELVLPRFFGQTRYASFQRQLNIYGFGRFTQGKDKGAYFHLCFVKGHRQLVRDMKRKKIKGVKSGAPVLPPVEQDFYHPAWVGHYDGSIPACLNPSAILESSVIPVNADTAPPSITPFPILPLVQPTLNVALFLSQPEPLSSVETFYSNTASLLGNEGSSASSAVASDQYIPACIISEDEQSYSNSDCPSISQELAENDAPFYGLDNTSGFEELDDHVVFIDGALDDCISLTEESDGDESLFDGALDDLFMETNLTDPSFVPNDVTEFGPFFKLFA